jgi:predicted amidohydrolase
MVIDPYGRIIASCEDGVESVETAEVDMDALEAFRKKFPVLNDSDVL